MLDVTAVCLEIWEKCLHHGARQSIADTLQLTEPDASRWVSFWAGLHDIGKASPDFQGNSQVVKLKLGNAGFKFNRKPDTYHGTATTCILQALFKNSLAPELARKISVTVGAHHGVFPQAEELQRTRPLLGEGLWNDARTELYRCMIDLCGMRDVPLSKGSPGNAFFMVLAGLTSVSDWIASNEEFFPYEIQHDLKAHPDYAKGKALEGLKKLGWIGWNPAQNQAQFGDLFKTSEGKPLQPRPLQWEAVGLTEQFKHQPGFVIIEAPMGEGKTEAAIHLADSWVVNLQQKGYYFALPTMATSDQMFGRVEEYLKKRYPKDRVNFMLLHGHSALSAEFKTLKDKFEARNLDADGKESIYDNASAGVIASEWFTYRKRGLLAPFGVGTIDQALLAVLQTRHVFVRLFGLAHKTVIIDEVHAYDAYMSTLLERLLEWLAALGSSVVLLSATLPRARKDALLHAYQKGLTGQGDATKIINNASYPRISWSVGNEVRAKTIETSDDSKKELNLQWVNEKIPEDDTIFVLGKSLQEKLQCGGCAAVICNTVDRSQRIYVALQKYFPVQDAGDGYPELDLLHARYLYGDRQDRQERSLKRFGKDITHRPRRAVLVATQVIEQSFDVDFDLMVTEMAPVDLLLQRAGRLHRHKRERPEGLKESTLWICEPEMKDGLPSFGGGTEVVYDYHILLRSWLAINSYVGEKPIMVPEDVESLIEKVYGKQDCPPELSDEMKKKWEESWGKLQGERGNEVTEAQDRWIKWPGYRQELWRICSEPREEDNPKFHKAHQALTRLTGLTVNVLCLSRSDMQLYLDSTFLRLLDNKVRPPRDLVKELLMRTVPVSRRGLVEKITEAGQKMPKAWREEPLLRHHYIMSFDENNRCEFKGYVLDLDPERGLLIEKI